MKGFKSDFDPNALPRMPRIATKQIIHPHDPGAQEQADEAHQSESCNSSIHSDGYYDDDEVH